MAGKHPGGWDLGEHGQFEHDSPDAQEQTERGSNDCVAAALYEQSLHQMPTLEANSATHSQFSSPFGCQQQTEQHQQEQTRSNQERGKGGKHERELSRCGRGDKITFIIKGRKIPLALGYIRLERMKDG